MRVVTNLNIKIWMMEGAWPEVLPHEKTHEAISEYYYAKAREIIEKLAPTVIGRKLPVPRKNAETSLDQLIETLSEDLNQEVMRQTRDRCQFAQDRFDTINQHGQIPVENSVAMTQAIAEENAHWEIVKNLKQASQ